MFRWLIILTACVISLADGLATARPGPDSNYNISVSTGGGGYTGPGDIVSFAGWWGLRAYSSAKRGTHAISLCDHLGANCADVLTDATTGVLNAPGTRGSDNCTSLTTCVVPTIYDQTASANNCTQATVANMATLNMTGGPGGNTPALVFNGTSAQYSCASATVSAFPVSESTVAERTGNTTAFGTAVSYGTQDDLGFNSAVNSAYVYAGSVLSASATDSAWHAMQGLFNTTGAIYIDGTNTTGSVGSTVPGGGASNIGHGIGGFLTGRLCEAGTVASDASGNFSSLNSNQHTFWGF